MDPALVTLPPGLVAANCMPALPPPQFAPSLFGLYPHVAINLRGGGRVDGLEELQELLVPVLAVVGGDDVAGGDRDYGRPG